MSPEALIAKLVSGASLGFLGLPGLLGGFIWAVLESGGLGFPDVIRETNFRTAGPNRPAGNGKVVRPKNVIVPDGGADQHEWQSARDLHIGARAYDFIVDRKRQAWWPVEPGEETTGYNGRWGTRVATDSVGRRAGTRFPPFWKMVFLALTTGKDAGVII